MQDFIRIHKNDNVAVALKPLPEGTVCDVEGSPVTVREEIPQGHKFALRDIAEGEAVVKYGFRIGTAK
jgi:altronate hydrolase